MCKGNNIYAVSGVMCATKIRFTLLYVLLYEIIKLIVIIIIKIKDWSL